MRRNSLRTRVVLALLTALQFTLPGVVAWADARLDAGPPGTAHIEDHSTAACPRMHPADCAFHRFLCAPVVGARVVPLAVRGLARPAPAPAARGLFRRAFQERLPDWRAPPTLS